MPLSQNIAQMIAQTRQNIPQVRQGRPPLMGLGKDTSVSKATFNKEGQTEQQEQSYRSGMLSLGQLVGQTFGPSKVKEMAKMAQSNFSKFSPEVQKMLVTKPEFQKRLGEFSKAGFTDIVPADKYFNDPNLEGFLMYAPIMGSAKEQAEIGSEKALQEERGARTEGLQQQTEQGKELHPLNVKEKKVGISAEEQRQKYFADENKRKEEMHPLEMASEQSKGSKISCRKG
jgi:hypothetical protein